MAARFSYQDIDRHSRHGKSGDELSDPTVPGLAYVKQGGQVYARYRGMVKGSKPPKRFSRYLGALPPASELVSEAKRAREKDPNAPLGSHVASELLERMRAEARALRNLVRRGVDPDAVASVTPAALRTVEDLADAYERTELPKLKPKTARDARAYLKRHVRPRLGKRPACEVGKEEIAELHAGLAKTPYQANRVLALVRVMFSKAVEWGWRPDNPAKGIKQFAEHEREEWYTAPEVAKLLVALRAIEAGEDMAARKSARALQLMLHTGARPSEVLSATWDMFDLDGGTWTKPGSSTKQKRVHHVMLNGDALRMLHAMRKEAGEATGFLFPSASASGHLMSVRRTWDTAIEAAGVRRLKTYEGTRHSHASVLVNEGVDLYTVGKLLGHSQPKTTARYAHLSAEAQRKAADKFSKLVKAGAAKPKRRATRKAKRVA